MNLANAATNKVAGERLLRLAKTEKLSHAYIFEGENPDNNLAFARAFAKAILCPNHEGNDCGRCNICVKVEANSHEDVFYVEKEGESEKAKKSVKIKEIRALSGNLTGKAFGTRNIAIVSDADTMTDQAQNAFLKTLEEPPEGTVIMLLSSNTDNLLDTIRSRCVTIHLRNEDDADDDFRPIAINIADLISKHASFLELREAMDKVTSRDDALALLDSLERLFLDIVKGRSELSGLYRKEDAYRIISLVSEARKDILRDISAKNTLRKLVLRIGG